VPQRVHRHHRRPAPSADTAPTPDEVTAHLDAIRSRGSYQVPLSHGDDVKAGVAPSDSGEAALCKDTETLRALFVPGAELAIPGSRLTGNEVDPDFSCGVFATSTPAPFMVRGDCVPVQIALRPEEPAHQARRPTRVACPRGAGRSRARVAQDDADGHRTMAAYPTP